MATGEPYLRKHKIYPFVKQSDDLCSINTSATCKGDMFGFEFMHPGPVPARTHPLAHNDPMARRGFPYLCAPVEDVHRMPQHSIKPRRASRAAQTWVPLLDKLVTLRPAPIPCLNQSHGWSLPRALSAGTPRAFMKPHPVASSAVYQEFYPSKSQLQGRWVYPPSSLQERAFPSNFNRFSGRWSNQSPVADFLSMEARPECD